MLQISALSTEYVSIPITVTEAGAPADPTDADVEIAFVLEGTDPETADWHTAEWETIDSTYYAKVLVGPLSSPLITLIADTTYEPHVRVTDSPERPVLKASPLRVF